MHRVWVQAKFRKPLGEKSGQTEIVGTQDEEEKEDVDFES